jgi:two-component system OmpR family response regulator
VHRVHDPRDALFLVTQETFDVVVALAIESGVPKAWPTLISEISTLAGRPIVVAMMRAVDAAARVELLRAGADACLVHPWSFIEVHERIQALRRVTRQPEGAAREEQAVCMPPAPRSPSSSGQDVALNPATRELVAGRDRLLLTKREYQLLDCLLRHRNAPVARDMLIRYAWSEKDDVDPASVNLVVSRLRRKLNERFSHVHIDTISRFGYQISVDEQRD